VIEEQPNIKRQGNIPKSILNLILYNQW